MEQGHEMKVVWKMVSTDHTYIRVVESTTPFFKRETRVHSKSNSALERI